MTAFVFHERFPHIFYSINAYLFINPDIMLNVASDVICITYSFFYFYLHPSSACSLSFIIYSGGRFLSLRQNHNKAVALFDVFACLAPTVELSVSAYVALESTEKGHFSHLPYSADSIIRQCLVPLSMSLRLFPIFDVIF